MRKLISFVRAGVEETGADKTKGGKERKPEVLNFPAWSSKSTSEEVKKIIYPLRNQRNSSVEGNPVWQE